MNGEPAPMSQSDGFLVRIAKHIQTYSPEILEAAGGVSLAAAQFVNAMVWSFQLSHLMLAIGAILLTVGLIMSAFRHTRITELESELIESDRIRTVAERGQKEAESALEKALESEVIAFYRRHALGPNERVSVYAFGGTDLFQLARYSQNPGLMDPGRERYVCDSGFIGDAWTQGECYVSDLPDPSTDLDAWRERQLESGIIDAIIDDLTMRSRSYLGRALRNPEDTRNVGVLMVESLAARGLATIRDELDSDDIVSLGVLIMLSSPQEETGIGVARRGGF